MAVLWIWGWSVLKKVDWEIDIPGVCKAGFSKELDRRPSRVLVSASSIRKAECWKQIWRQPISGLWICFFSFLLPALPYFVLLWWASFLLFSGFFSPFGQALKKNTGPVTFLREMSMWNIVSFDAFVFEAMHHPPSPCSFSLLLILQAFYAGWFIHCPVALFGAWTVMTGNDKACDIQCFSAFLRKSLTDRQCLGPSVHLKPWSEGYFV